MSRSMVVLPMNVTDAGITLGTVERSRFARSASCSVVRVWLLIMALMPASSISSVCTRKVPLNSRSPVSDAVWLSPSKRKLEPVLASSNTSSMVRPEVERAMSLLPVSLMSPGWMSTASTPSSLQLLTWRSAGNLSWKLSMWMVGMCAGKPLVVSTKVALVSSNFTFSRLTTSAEIPVATAPVMACLACPSWMS